MPQMEWIWLIALVLFSLLEAATSALVSLWFIGGSLVGLIAALCNAPLWLQALLFFLVSAALLLLLRPLARKYFTPRTVATNAAGNIGKEALVTQAIDNLNAQGEVKLGGALWTARSCDGSIIAEGTVVRIERIEGVKLLVTPKTTKEVIS